MDLRAGLVAPAGHKKARLSVKIVPLLEKKKDMWVVAVGSWWH